MKEALCFLLLPDQCLVLNVLNIQPKKPANTLLGQLLVDLGLCRMTQLGGSWGQGCVLQSHQSSSSIMDSNCDYSQTNSEHRFTNSGQLMGF